MFIYKYTYILKHFLGISFGFCKKKMTLQALAEQVCQISMKAGKTILDVYDTFDPTGIKKKEDDSPLTIADQKSNEIICFHLKDINKKYPIISEENKQVDYEERKEWKRCWLVDPLDGTKEFIKRNGDFTVNIALVEDQKIILGVVYIPVTNKCYFAFKDGGAHEYISAGNYKKLEAMAFSKTDEGLKFVCSRSHLSEETKTYVNQFNKPEFVSRGSSLKFLIIANNEAHIYPRLGPTMEWDTAAAHIILEEAGGKVYQLDQKELRYNKENLLNPYFIAEGNTN